MRLRRPQGATKQEDAPKEPWSARLHFFDEGRRLRAAVSSQRRTQTWTAGAQLPAPTRREGPEDFAHEIFSARRLRGALPPAETLHGGVYADEIDQRSRPWKGVEHNLGRDDRPRWWKPTLPVSNITPTFAKKGEQFEYRNANGWGPVQTLPYDSDNASSPMPIGFGKRRVISKSAAEPNSRGSLVTPRPTNVTTSQNVGESLASATPMPVDSPPPAGMANAARPASAGEAAFVLTQAPKGGWRTLSQRWAAAVLSEAERDSLVEFCAFAEAEEQRLALQRQSLRESQESKIVGQSFKNSQTYLNLRKKQQMAARSKDYSAAASFKQDADKLDAEERAKHSIEIERRLGQLKAKFCTEDASAIAKQDLELYQRFHELVYEGILPQLDG